MRALRNRKNTINLLFQWGFRLEFRVSISPQDSALKAAAGDRRSRDADI
jgi:hypothetical protein